MNLSIIIVTFNTGALLKNCLESIFKNVRNISFEVIVVDNNSADSTSEMVKEEFSRVKLIENRENLGFARANNQGARIAQGKYLLFLNSDTIVKGESLDKVVEYLDKHPKIAVLGPKLILPDGSEQLWAYGPEMTLWQVIKNHLKRPSFIHRPSLRKRGGGSSIIQTDWVSGAALFVRRDIFEKVRGFDENFFMYFEDQDLCKRVRGLGYEVAYWPEAEIIHLGGKSIAKNRQRKKIYYQSQNYYFRKHFSSFTALLMRLIRFPFKILKSCF